jgi:hypothetical protein
LLIYLYPQIRNCKNLKTLNLPAFPIQPQLPPLPFTLRSSIQESHNTYISREEVENGIMNDKGIESEDDITTASEEDTDDLLDSEDDIEFAYDEDDEKIEDINTD